MAPLCNARPPWWCRAWAPVPPRTRPCSDGTRRRCGWRRTRWALWTLGWSPHRWSMFLQDICFSNEEKWTCFHVAVKHLDWTFGHLSLYRADIKINKYTFEGFRNLFTGNYLLRCQSLKLWRWWRGTSSGSGSSLLEVSNSHQGLNKGLKQGECGASWMIQPYWFRCTFHILSCAAFVFIYPSRFKHPYQILKLASLLRFSKPP